LKRRNLLAGLWGLVVCLLLSHNAYLWLVQRLAPDTDILALLPAQQHDAVLQQSFSRMAEAAQQRLIVVVGADDWAAARRAADAYRAVLKPRDDLMQLNDRVTDQTLSDELAQFQQHRIVLFTAQDEAALRGQGKEYWVDVALTKLYSPFGGVNPVAWQDDPLGLFGAWAQARAQETPVRPRDGRLYVGDGRREYVVLPITLRAPAFSLAAQRAVMPLLEQARHAAQRIVPQVEVLVVGVIVHAAAAGKQASWELSIIGFGSILGIVLLIWLAFHSLKPIALVMLSIAVGCLGALSASWLLFDRLHLLSLVFGASLIGGAQDYGIYFLCNRVAADAQIDSWQLLRRLLPALLLALITTVAGYMGLALTPFPGLRQIAVFSALGLVFAWLTVVFWFPLLVRSDTLGKIRLAPWYTGSMARWPLLGRDRRTLVAATIFAALAIFGWSRLGISDDIRLLQNPPKSLLDDQIKLSKLLDLPTPAQFYLVRGATAEAVLQREEELKQRLDPLIEKRLISGYHAMSNWVPSARAQVARVQLIEQKVLNDGGPLAGLAARIGAGDQWVTATRERLQASALPLRLEDFLKSPTSEPWRYLWIGQVDVGYASIVAVKGLSKAGLPSLEDAAAGLDGVRWVDTVGAISTVLGRYRQYMGWVVALAYIVVYGLLYPRYRRATWRVLAPTALASIATLALLGIAGQSLQLFHVLALMLILGVGVDYGIFLQEHGVRRNPIAWLAVVLSALSTLLSFGLLSLSKTPALQAFGVTMLIGTTVVWLIVPCFDNHQVEKEGAPRGL
jgi:predicted exporter